MVILVFCLQLYGSSKADWVLVTVTVKHDTLWTLCWQSFAWLAVQTSVHLLVAFQYRRPRILSIFPCMLRGYGKGRIEKLESFWSCVPGQGWSAISSKSHWTFGTEEWPQLQIRLRRHLGPTGSMGEGSTVPVITLATWS
jgi:hypothetical protein